jgi:hypothetical protein
MLACNLQILCNMVVAEMFKQLCHHGRRPRLSFYRDRSGNEVDPIVERGRELAALEVKSGQTVTRDCLTRFAGI